MLCLWSFLFKSHPTPTETHMKSQLALMGVDRATEGSCCFNESIACGFKHFKCRIFITPGYPEPRKTLLLSFTFHFPGVYSFLFGDIVPQHVTFGELDSGNRAFCNSLMPQKSSLCITQMIFPSLCSVLPACFTCTISHYA